ncbi:MAG: response regulator transcription factor [Bacteroidetes bacterium]|nr:response regulator transcription factor [Bacteroidota bacterium]
MIKTVLVDDDERQIHFLTDCIAADFPQLSIAGVAHSVPEAEKLIKEVRPELVFLDIDMPPYTSFDLLKNFPNPFFSIIFITGHEDYALKAYEVAAIDYIVKPFNPESLHRAVSRFEQHHKNNHAATSLETLLYNYKIDSNKDMKLTLPKGRDFEVVLVRDIIRMEGEGNYTHIFMKSGKHHLSTRQLGIYEKALKAFNFFRIHKSHLINLDQIIKFCLAKPTHVIMADDIKIEVARYRKEEFLQHISNDKRFFS